jgi:predicted nuclease with RNAse H fold
MKRNGARYIRTHLRDGPLNRIPHANKIWMLYGFEIFKALRKTGGYEVIEVYPYAIVKTLLTDPPSKKTPDGYRCQLESVAAATNWTPIDLERALKRSVPGTNRDRLDAFMAASVASLPKRRRRAIGNEDDPDDAIWVPR